MQQQTAILLKSEFESALLRIIRFWHANGTDEEEGGYLTCLDENARRGMDTDKYIVTQTRMIWGFSAFGGHYGNTVWLDHARQGVRFFIDHFWDGEHGGWRWKTARDGRAIDSGKLTYGQCFAIYALAEFYKHTGDAEALEYAERTFDLLQIYAADTQRGGYYENMEPDWTIAESGFAGGDRKSLDIHMHVMESFTVLAACTNKEVHLRKLNEVTALIADKMIQPDSGCGMNQFTLGFVPIPAIDIKRTWNAERKQGETVAAPLDSTSYGHNLELAWLFNKAGEVLGSGSNAFNDVNRKLVEHALKYGFDHQLGGVYRDGPHEGPAVVTDKEFWQNQEALVGLLDAYETIGDPRYSEAFQKLWSFAKSYMIHPKYGEWRQMVASSGEVKVGDLGNPWKACYHSGRAMLECIIRLDRIGHAH